VWHYKLRKAAKRISLLSIILKHSTQSKRREKKENEPLENIQGEINE
jgi:hypothetical protein